MMLLLQKELVGRGLDCALFFTDENVNPNLFYFTGYVGAGTLIVYSNGDKKLLVPSRDLSMARKSKIKNVEIICGKKLVDILSINELKIEKVGLDFSNLSVRNFNLLKERVNCEFFDISEFMSRLRMIKKIDEINKIKKSCKITDKIIGKFVNNFSEFKTEEEAVAFLVYETRRFGCGLAFEPIVASGINAAVPHHISKGKIKRGFCVVDFGVKFEGYCSDVTRTFYVGKPSKKESKIYYSLLKAQKKAISMIRNGVGIKNITENVEKMTGSMIHALGHGLGIEVHELPYVSISSEEILRSGMIITVEPGVYVDGKYGIRIEDDVLVTKTGREVLSKFTKELICV